MKHLISRWEFSSSQPPQRECRAPLKKSSRMLTLECVVNFITFQLKFTTAGWLKSHFPCFAHFSSSQWNSCYIIAGIIHNLSFIHQGSRAFSTMTKKNFLCRYDFPLAHFILEFSKIVTTIFFPWWFRSARSLSRLCRSWSAHFFTFFHWCCWFSHLELEFTSSVFHADSQKATRKKKANESDSESIFLKSKKASWKRNRRFFVNVLSRELAPYLLTREENKIDVQGGFEI